MNQLFFFLCIFDLNDAFSSEFLIEDKHPKFALKEKERRAVLQRLELMWGKVGFSSLGQ